MKLIRIARRNVNRQARRSNLLAGAIGFGLAIILLVSSFTAGIVDSAQKTLSSFLGGHVYVSGQLLLDSGKTVSRIANTEAVDAVLPQVEDHIQSLRKRSTTQGTFIFGSSTVNGSLYGVVWDEEPALLKDAEVVEGSLEDVRDPSAVVLSQSIVEDLGVALQERVIVRFETVTGQANVAEFNLKAVIQDGQSFGMGGLAYVNRGALNPLLGLEENEYQTLSIALKDVTAMETVADTLEAGLAERAPVEPREDADAMAGPAMMFGAADEIEPWEGTRFSVATLDDYMGPLTQMITILNQISLGLFIVLLLIIMVGLVNTFRMILIERTQEIGTMRAIGLQRPDVGKLFLLEALFVGARGALFGLIGAAVIGTIIAIIPFNDAGGFALMLQNGHVAMPVMPGSIAGVLVILAVAVLGAAWFPSRRAARLLPAEALRS